MEALDHKIDRIKSDVDTLVELYDYAERLYPYDRIREPRKVLTFLNLSIDHTNHQIYYS